MEFRFGDVAVEDLPNVQIPFEKMEAQGTPPRQKSARVSDLVSSYYIMNIKSFSKIISVQSLCNFLCLARNQNCSYHLEISKLHYLEWKYLP